MLMIFASVDISGPFCHFAYVKIRMHVINFDYMNFDLRPASWSSGNVFVSEAGGLRFKSRAGQIGRSVVHGSPPLRHFFERSCFARAQ